VSKVCTRAARAHLLRSVLIVRRCGFFVVLAVHAHSNARSKLRPLKPVSRRLIRQHLYPLSSCEQLQLEVIRWNAQAGTQPTATPQTAAGTPPSARSVTCAVCIAFAFELIHCRACEQM